jgi:hypothetical protein
MRRSSLSPLRGRVARLTLVAVIAAALLSAAIAATTAPAQVLGRQAPRHGVNWFPGYYVLSDRTDSILKKMLQDPLVAPFTGVQLRYHWADSERSRGDYSRGFAQLDHDLKIIAGTRKKLLVMLQYKSFDRSPAVPAYLLAPGGPWCSGRYCGQLSVGHSSLAMVWNPAVNARLRAWIRATAVHLARSRYASSVAGIVFNETSLPTDGVDVLREAGYDPYRYMYGLQANLLAATRAAPRLPVFYYHEGGFVSMNGESVNAGQIMGDWMLRHPHIGTGTPDLKPKDPKSAHHPCANPLYQGRIPCNPDVQSRDYDRDVTDSLQQTLAAALRPAPVGLRASYVTFSYTRAPDPSQAFTFAEVSAYIARHAMPKTAIPPGW